MKGCYKITSPSGEVTITNSLNSFAKSVGIYYGQFYTALHQGTKTVKGGYKVEWHKDTVDQKYEGGRFKITDPIGIVHYTNSYTDFARSINVSIHGFKKVLTGKQRTCYGGYTIERLGNEDKETPIQENPNNRIVDHIKNVTDFYKKSSKNVEILDIIREGNVHKIKFKNTLGNIHTRKIELRRVNNLTGQKCDYSGVIVPIKGLYATCSDGKDTYNFSVDQIKQLGYDFSIDFSTSDVIEKVVEKRIESFSPDLLEEQIQSKMDKLIKEIKVTQDRLSQLKILKENLGKSLSQIKIVNTNLNNVDKILKGVK